MSLPHMVLCRPQASIGATDHDPEPHEGRRKWRLGPGVLQQHGDLREHRDDDVQEQREAHVDEPQDEERQDVQEQHESHDDEPQDEEHQDVHEQHEGHDDEPQDEQRHDVQEQRDDHEDDPPDEQRHFLEHGVDPRDARDVLEMLLLESGQIGRAHV